MSPGQKTRGRKATMVAAMEAKIGQAMRLAASA